MNMADEMLHQVETWNLVPQNQRDTSESLELSTWNLCQGQDNTSLVYLNDASILQNLKARHQECPWVPRGVSCCGLIWDLLREAAKPQEDAIYTYTASASRQTTRD